MVLSNPIIICAGSLRRPAAGTSGRRYWRRCQWPYEVGWTGGRGNHKDATKPVREDVEAKGIVENIEGLGDTEGLEDTEDMEGLEDTEDTEGVEDVKDMEDVERGGHGGHGNCGG